MFKVAQMVCSKWAEVAPKCNLKEDINPLHMGVLVQLPQLVCLDSLKEDKDKHRVYKVMGNKDKDHREVTVIYHQQLDLLDNCNQIFKEYYILM